MSLFVPEEQRVSITVRSLNVVLSAVDTNKRKWWQRRRTARQPDVEQTSVKCVLNNLNLDLPQGQVLAILGSSGSGKTTFLNTLSSRMSFALDNNPFSFSGSVQYSQASPNVSYLLQDDAFLPGLTVRETLHFTSQLRLPHSSKKERHELIEYLIESLGLERVGDTIICDFLFRSTLSGGERRRVSLAIQLLTKPSVLFLDEPTTGLDAHTSISLVSTVKQLAVQFGITVILTIHQPRYEILEIVDKLYLLAKGGNLMFSGSLKECKTYFGSVGVESDDSNFADFLLNISSVDKTLSNEVEKETQQRVQMLIQEWKKHEQLLDVDVTDTFEAGAPLFSKDHVSNTLRKEVWIIIQRCTLMALRDRQSLIMMMGTVTTLAIICGWVFYKPGGSLAGIRSVTSTLYVCCEVIGFTPMMYEIERLCSVDGKFLIREHKEGMYSISSWFIGRRIAKMFLEDIPSTLIWCLITFYMWGLNGHSNFGIFFINNLFLYMIGIALAHTCFVLGGYQFALSSLISGIFYQIENSACGYFISAKTMPVYVRWTKYIASFWYNFGSLVSNQFTDYMGNCVGTEDECLEYSGQAVLDNLGYPRHWKTVPLVVSLGWFILFYVTGAWLFWWNERVGTVKIVKERRPKRDHVTPLEEFDLKPTDLDDIKLCVSLNDISLHLKPSLMSTVLQRPFIAKTILSNVNVSFQPGVNVIMGPSGSGKTTLLNFLTGRIRSSLMSVTGLLRLNGEVIKVSDLSQITSYVVQDDNVLIPTLTVLETLQYQARLRLPAEMHSQIPSLLQDMMKKMGLTEVANVPIGDSVTKGISGGEKRRVSIAVQLLNDSKVLLLDEPTSGLDSFTSSQIVSLLEYLAKTENKTIIMTIHQPKVELFNQFDNVLLLGDGQVLFDGKPNDLIGYFGEMGFEAPSNVNFADYVLDTISTGGDMKEKLIGSWLKRSNDKAELQVDRIPDITSIYKQHQPLGVVFRPVLERQCKVLMRNRDVLYSRVLQLMLLGVVHALYFAPLKHTSDSISNRLGLIQEVLNMYFVGLFNNMAFFPGEKKMFYQEYQDRVYSPGVFMGVYLLTELPFEMFATLVFSVFVVFVIGLPRTATMFFTMFYMSLLSLNCGESVGVIFNTVFDHTGVAMNFLANLIVVAIFMGGTMSLHMPVLFKAFNYISPLKWAVLALAKLGFEGQAFECVGGGTCALGTGEAVLEQYNLQSSYAVDMAVVAGIVVAYRLAAWAVLEVKVRSR